MHNKGQVFNKLLEDARKKQLLEVKQTSSILEGEQPSPVLNIEDDIQKSTDHADDPAWIESHKSYFVDYISSTYIKENGGFQKKGIDRLIHLKRGKSIGVDEKYDNFKGDTVFLEIYSDKDRGTPGWWTDTSKECDYIAFMKKANDNEVHYFPFLCLQRLWYTQGEDLKRKYGTKSTRKASYDSRTGLYWRSEGIVMPITDIKKALRD